MGPISREAPPDTDPEVAAQNIPLALVGWLSGCVMIWSSLFTVGSFLYGRYATFFVLLTIFVASGLVLLWVINRLWRGQPVREPVLADAE